MNNARIVSATTPLTPLHDAHHLRPFLWRNRVEWITFCRKRNRANGYPRAVLHVRDIAARKAAIVWTQTKKRVHGPRAVIGKTSPPPEDRSAQTACGYSPCLQGSTRYAMTTIRGQRSRPRKVELSGPQVSAAKTLLGKVLPDLQAIQHEGEIVQRVVSRKPLSAEEWAAQHAGQD
jgi:hypothetical protein